jgi:acyl-CoA thioester hydrolase
MTSIATTFPVAIERPVRWGDMDAFQHVNNTVYFRWFECARIAYFQRIGFVGAESVGPILAHTECRFRRPVAFPDTVTIRAGVTELGTDRFTMAYRVDSAAAGGLVAEGTGRVVSFDYVGSAKSPVPAGVLSALRELEGLG